MRILYNSKDSRFKTPFGTLIPGERCDINIHIPTSCQTKAVCLCLNQEDERKYASFYMDKSGSAEDYDYFSVSFSLPKPGLFFYHFEIETENENFRLYRQGFDQTNMEEGELWQLSCVPADFSVPEEYQGSVMYQIFPDRFYQAGICDTTGKIAPFWIHSHKDELPHYLPDEKGEVCNCDFFGGNLAGISEKLDYLQELGVKVIYLNPIFKAWSNHRYDTADYKKIDELLGTEADFSRLCRLAHEKGMRIILDGVFSHTGSRSLYFDELDQFGCGAFHHPNSPYRSWFDFQSYPEQYTSWWGIKTLPCVNEMEPSYLDFIIDSEDSVIAHWLRAGADGFRLDVADELPDAFIQRLRARLKELKPDSLLIGEVWEDASNKCSYGVRRQYFTSGELDSVMNYPFRNAILDFVTGKDPGIGFRNAVMDLVENYPPQVTQSLMNMLSTHDTPRILSLLSPGAIPGDKKDRAGFRMGDGDRAVALERYFCASFLQFILPGMPCIFYADEIGVEGLEDPFCRLYFPWDLVAENPILDFFKALSRFRSEHSALRNGNLAVASDGNGVVEILRTNGEETVRAVINVGEKREFSYAGDLLFSAKARLDGKTATLSSHGFFAEKCL